ncbi:MAG: glycosyltransferase family protein [Pseudomonadota bacterium]
MTSLPNLKIVATIEARMTSSRLPGKVLMPVLGAAMLQHLVTRLRAVPSIDAIVLATTVNAADEPLAEFAAAQGIACFRGSEDDVMQRVIDAAESMQADIVVEITGDCPIIDPQIIEQAIRMFKAHDAAYVGNAQIRSYPDGMDVQVFRLDTLKQSAALTADPLDREHVTLHIRNHPEIFPHVHLVAPPEIHWPTLGLTLDEQADYELLKRIMGHFSDKPLFSCLEAVTLLRANPQWLAINEDVRRKGDA